MTEIQWLIDIMLNHKLTPKTKEAFIKRIGEVESKYSQPTIVATPAQRSVRAPTTEELEAPPVHARKVIPQEIVTATGNGTSVKGPRKW